MQELKKRLPPLDPLVAFEAAARHGSFVAASDELSITPSAVSQQIKVLESRLGKQLFERKHRAVVLTDTGREFQNSVAVALLHLANATQQLVSHQKNEELIIAFDTSVASYWISSRMTELQNRFPNVNFRFNVTDSQTDLLEGEFDLAIVHGMGNWRGLESRLLFDEEVFPVCAPAYLERQMGEVNANNLAEMDLLDLEYEQWHWMNWAIWLTKKGIEVPDRPMKLKSNFYPTLIEAAKSGLGVTLGWRHLIDAEINRGTLVEFLPDTVFTDNAYYVVWPFNVKLGSTTEQFVNWLIGQQP